MKNWTIKEAVEEINKGNQEAIDEVAKHYPLAFMAIARNDLAGLSQLMGDKFTMNRLAKQIVANNAEAEDDGAANSSTATKETEVPNDGDLESMTTKQLMQLCDKRGIKVPHYGKNKQFYLDALQNAGGDETEDNGEEVSDDPYEGKSAMELYKLAKKRGLKVEPKKKAAVYAEVLRKDDAEQEAAANDDSDDGWGDGEDAEDEAPKKDTGKGTKKAPTKKAEPAKEEDDEDDWDI